MSDDLAAKVAVRREVLDELRSMVNGIACGGRHVIVLSDYEVANLAAMFRAMGCAAVVDRNPLMAANTGDWVGQIASRLPHVEHPPNADWKTLAQRANEFR